MVGRCYRRRCASGGPIAMRVGPTVGVVVPSNRVSYGARTPIAYYTCVFLWCTILLAKIRRRALGALRAGSRCPARPVPVQVAVRRSTTLLEKAGWGCLLFASLGGTRGVGPFRFHASISFSECS